MKLTQKNFENANDWIIADDIDGKTAYILRWCESLNIIEIEYYEKSRDGLYEYSETSGDGFKTIDDLLASETWKFLSNLDWKDARKVEFV